MLHYFANACIALITSILLVHCVKSVRSQRGALSKLINLDDLLILLLPASLILIAQWAAIPLVKAAIFGVLSLYGILVWLDAILFVQYRIEINRQTIAWFFTGSKGLSKGVPHLLALFNRFPVALLIPPVWVSTLFGLIYLSQGLAVQALIVCASLAVICRWFITASVVQTLLLAVVATGVMSMSVAVSGDWFLLLSGVFGVTVSAIVLLAVLRKLFISQHEFLTAPTLLANILVDDSFDAASAFTPREEHRPFVSPGKAAKQKSPYFGRCKDANIILVTMESLGCYINPYTANAAHSRLAKRLQPGAWMSQQHFSLCPNTTVSTNQMYTGHYSNNPYNKSDSLFPGKDPMHIAHLRAQGYKTLFLDSADIGLYDYERLLARIGFDRVWGTNDIPAKGLKADYRLWNMVDEIVAEVADGPFFLHVINDQTHMPYEVVNGERFNRHAGNSQKAKYLNAVEEVDFILDEFLQRLGKKVDLSNTIVVFTGDHGESFGEFGYSFHSNSVILPQITVPFMLCHPNLRGREIEHSCHFDLFPTFFDLLGIEFDYPSLGSPLGCEQRDFAYFAHSATLKGNSPANFGFINNGELLWMDRLFNQVSLLSSEQVRRSLSAKEQTYAKSLLHKMLSERGVLVS